MVILYSDNDWKSKDLKKKLQDRGIEFKEVTDYLEINEKGVFALPSLEVDEGFMDYKNASKWITSLRRS